MRIVLLSTGHPVYDIYPDGGGIQYQIEGLASEMARRGHEVHIVCRQVRESIDDSRVVYHALDGRGKDQILSVLLFSKAAADLIDAIDPDVVSAFERFSAYFPSLKGFATTFTAQNYDAFRQYRSFAIEYNPLNVFVHPWKCRLEENVMRRSRLVIALTPSTRDYLVSVGINHLKVIPNAVRVEDYCCRGDGKYILYAGRLDAPKRVDLLIRAYGMMRERHGEYSLRIVGSGPMRSDLRDMVEGLGLSSHVKFNDWLPRMQLIEELANCSLLVLPSDYETFGIVALEAMACSKPVIASAISGPGEFIDHGKDGLLFKRGSAMDLADKIDRTLTDPSMRVMLGKAARRKVETSYDFTIAGNQMIEAVSHLL